MLPMTKSIKNKVNQGKNQCKNDQNDQKQQPELMGLINSLNLLSISQTKAKETAYNGVTAVAACSDLTRN